VLIDGLNRAAPMRATIDPGSVTAHDEPTPVGVARFGDVGAGDGEGEQARYGMPVKEWPVIRTRPPGGGLVRAASCRGRLEAGAPREVQATAVSYNSAARLWASAVHEVRGMPSSPSGCRQT
jgi:hypothetical protein